MATPPDVVRAELAVVTAAAAAELRAAAGESVDDMLGVLDLVIPPFYDAAGSLAVAWYDEIRDESQPSTAYAPSIIGDPATDWIEREVEKYLRTVAVEVGAQAAIDETMRLAEKEVARGYRDSILGNVRSDTEAIGWSRVARPGACKMCSMLADKGAVYSEETATFAAHKSCNCAARPEFRNGEHGPEASVIQYVASAGRAKSEKAQAARNAKLRAYLNQHYPEAPG